MNQMAKGLLFGAAVLSQTAAGCFSAAAASINQVRIRLAAEEFDEMGMPVLEAESRDRAYSVTGVERISGDPASGPAMDGAEVGKKENEQYKGSIQADSENIGTKEVSLEERKIEEIHAEEPAPEILYEIELESDADDSFSVLRQEDIQFSGLGAVCSKAVRKDRITGCRRDNRNGGCSRLGEKRNWQVEESAGGFGIFGDALPGCEACRTSASDEC